MEQPRRTVDIADMRLQRLFISGAQLATLTEYARKSEMDIMEVLSQLEPYLDDHSIELESVGAELFLHTAPLGRPQPENVASIPANLWELLRYVGDPDYASMLWKIIRGLETGGWSVRTHPIGSPRPLTFLEIHVNGSWVPVIVLPRKGRLAAHDGPLSRADGRKVTEVVVVCPEGHLDEVVSEIRTWMTSAKRTLTVVLLEQPRYTPALLSPNDTSVRPTSISRTVPRIP
jgi:hypothetical protein